VKLDMVTLYSAMKIAKLNIIMGFKMSDTTDDMECAAGGLFCRECEEHFTDCECEEEE
jgi:hypothetical protein